jgi:pimeloyl-ACP methyl ester carboxylesterase
MNKEIIPFQNKSIAVYTSGSPEKKAIVFIHGNSMSSKIWQKQFANDLSNKYCLIAIDLPGHGESDDFTRYDLPVLTNSVITVINHFNLKEYVLVGNSLGGDIILQCWAELKNCKGIILVNTPPLGKPSTMQNAMLPYTLVAMLFTKDCDVTKLDALAENLFLKKETTPGFFKQDFIRTDGTMRQHLVEAVAGLNYNDEIEAVRNMTMPVAIILGKSERLLNNNYYNSLQVPKLWKNEINLVENAAHCPQWENAKEFNNLLNTFCDSVYTNPLVNA